jgi:hypothetical protein
MAPKTSGDIVIGVRIELLKAEKQLRKVQKTMNNGGKNFDVVARAQERVRMGNEKLKKSLGQTPFAGWAMSIMFFGMAMKRVFDTVWKSSTRTFQDIMHSTAGTVTGFDNMDAAAKYLGFTIGAALEPIAEFLAPIIWAFADWVSENEELVAGILITIGVVGTLLMNIGMLKLGIIGLKDASVLLNKTQFGKSMLALFTNPAFLIGMAALTAFAAITWKSFKETPAAWEAVKDSALNLKKSTIPALTTLIDKMTERTFGWKFSWTETAWEIAWAFQILAKGVEGGVQRISAVGNALLALNGPIRMAMGLFHDLWEAVTFQDFDFDHLQDATDDAMKDIDDMLAALGAAGKADVDLLNLISDGPNEFRRQQEERQAREASNAEALRQFQLGGGFGGGVNMGDINVYMEPGQDAFDVSNTVLEEMMMRTQQ